MLHVEPLLQCRACVREVAEHGFTNVKVLYLADNFGTSWVNLGYRVDGAAGRNILENEAATSILATQRMNI